jgi:N-acetylneuraminate synthase
MRRFKLGNIIISHNTPPIIIAEIGINHNGKLSEAIKIASEAIKNGADIIKHQTHIVSDEMSFVAQKVIPGNSKKSIYQIIDECSLSEEDEFKLMQFVKKKKKIFISTPFSRAAVNRLEKFKVPGYKIGSGECNNYPLVEYIARKRKPVILSTGMNDFNSIDTSIKILKKYRINFALMHCTNLYPTPNNLTRLECLQLMKKKYPSIIIGYSDHTVDNYASLGAVALGAQIIEKHFTYSKNIKGPDISCSMNGKDLKNLKIGSKKIFLGLKGKKKPLLEEIPTINFAFASVTVVKNIEKGEAFTKENIFTLRPYNGHFKVKDYKDLLGKIAKKNLHAGYQLKKSDVK